VNVIFEKALLFLATFFRGDYPAASVAEIETLLPWIIDREELLSDLLR